MAQTVDGQRAFLGSGLSWAAGFLGSGLSWQRAMGYGEKPLKQACPVTSCPVTNSQFDNPQFDYAPCPIR